MRLEKEIFNMIRCPFELSFRTRFFDFVCGICIDNTINLITKIGSTQSIMKCFHTLLVSTRN